MTSPKPSGNEVALSELFPIIEEKLQNGAEITFKPNGVSMLPMLRPGKDSITIKRKKTLDINDVVLYHRPNGQFVLHRLIAIKNNEYIFCGDNQWQLEHGITDDMILGVVISFCRCEKQVALDGPVYQLYLRFLWFLRLFNRTKYLFSRVIRKLRKLLSN